MPRVYPPSARRTQRQIGSVHEHVVAARAEGTLDLLAELLRNPERLLVPRGDEADDVACPEMVMRPHHGRAGGFGGVAIAPVLVGHCPADLERRPVGRVVEAGAPNELAGRTYLERPMAEPLERPVPGHHRHLPPRLGRRHPGVVAVAAGDGGVAHDLGPTLMVRVAPAAKQQALGLDLGWAA